MNISEFEMYELLREKMDEKQARMLVEFIEFRVEKKFEEARDVFATKDDIHRLELKIAEIHLKIAESKNDFIKWHFGMIIGSTLAVIGTILTVMQMGG
ncbi:MAG: hypothetical protein SFY32_06600 [Bacteroidota bacterium]|nr:hypothetical protein [Bacteroidota bacterium]